MKRILPIVAGVGIVILSVALRRTAEIVMRPAKVQAVEVRVERSKVVVADPEGSEVPAVDPAPVEPEIDDRFEGSCEQCGLEERAHEHP